MPQDGITLVFAYAGTSIFKAYDAAFLRSVHDKTKLHME